MVTATERRRRQWYRWRQSNISTRKTLLLSLFFSLLKKCHRHFKPLTLNCTYIFTVSLPIYSMYSLSLSLSLWLIDTHWLNDWLITDGVTRCVFVCTAQVCNTNFKSCSSNCNLHSWTLNVVQPQKTRSCRIQAIKLFEMCMHSRTLSSCIVGNRACINTIHCSMHN